ncbi:MAG: gliding motility-associated C-terminal domain-containing protein [Bacteroidetes bacterium]|nr:gliding motility-associated C-terminal domain-containing protein [Bacteroidota bacterium]
MVIGNPESCQPIYSNPLSLKVSKRPEVPKFLNSITTVCSGSNYIFRIENQKNSTFSWVLPVESSGKSNANADSLWITFSKQFSQGVLKVMASNDCGVSETQTPISSFEAPKKPALTGDIALCSNANEIRKDIQPVQFATEYEWQLPDLISFNPYYQQNSVTLFANVGSTFQSGYVRVRAIGKCEKGPYSDPIIISRIPIPTSPNQISGPDLVCTTASSAVSYRVPSLANAVKYEWKISGAAQPQSISLTNQITLNFPVEGISQIDVRGVNSCGEKGTPITINVRSYEPLKKPSIQISDCDKTLNAIDANKPIWFLNGLQLFDLNEQKIAAYDSGVYHVQVSNFCGPKFSDPIKVYPVLEGKTFIPNVITPNNDGKNDFFVIDKSLKGSQLTIFNRWGSEVFSRNDYLNDWEAKDLASGTYFYVISNPCLNNPLNGWISVLR